MQSLASPLVLNRGCFLKEAVGQTCIPADPPIIRRSAAALRAKGASICARGLGATEVPSTMAMANILKPRPVRRAVKPSKTVRKFTAPSGSTYPLGDFGGGKLNDQGVKR